jgi:tetratricopeptide (TPR) repeat protein
MKLLTFLTLLVISLLVMTLSHASNLNKALGIYLDKVAKTNSIGVVEQDELLFFIAEQTCLTKKKHSGTKESRNARKKISELIAQEFTKHSKGLTRDKISYPDVIGDAVYDKALANLTKSNGYLRSKSKLIIDQEIAPCIQRVVTAMPLDDFKKQQINSPTVIDEQALLMTVISDAIAQNNSAWLANLFTHFGSHELAIAYQLKSIDDGRKNWPLYDTVINTSQVTANNQETILACDFSAAIADQELARLSDIAQRGWCSAEITTPVFVWQQVNDVSTSASTIKKKLLTVDYTGAVNIVFNAHGVVDFASVPGVYRSMAQNYFVKAELLFKSGKQADEIIRLLTVSLNLDPKNYQGWSLLGTMLRAKKSYSLALSCYFQSLLQQPQNPDLWINIAKSLAALNHPVEANKLASIALKFSKPFSASEWAQKQAQAIINKNKPN